MLKAEYYIEPSEIDHLVFEKLIPTEHYLRQVKEEIDFEFVRKEVADCYSASMGRCAADPVLLFKLGYLQVHYGLSDQGVLCEAQVNVAYRYFLNLSLESGLPSSGLLSQFRSRLGLEKHQNLFDQIVGQAREKGFVHDRLRLKDATHILSQVAIPTTIQLVAQARQKLLMAVEPYGAEKVEEAERKANQIRLATSDLKNEQRLLARIEHLRSIVNWADSLSTQLGPVDSESEPQRLRFEQALSIAHKVLQDQADPKANDRLRSVVDPDMRKGLHGSYYDGYMLDLLVDADSELITALNILPANGAEAQDALDLIQAEEEAHGNDIQALSIDGIGWNGRVLRQLSAADDPDDPEVIVFVPPQVRPTDGALFTPDDFTLDESGTILTCPDGTQTSTRSRNQKNVAWQYFFPLSVCRGCSLLDRCMDRLPKWKGRSVQKNDYQPEYEAAWALSRTDSYTQVRALHHRVERKFADLVANHNARSTPYRTQPRVKMRYLMTAIACNIKRIITLTKEQPRPPLAQLDFSTT